jgi:hypothetical protein
VKKSSHLRTLPWLALAAVAGIVSTGGRTWAANYSFQTLDNATDPTFNQLLGINAGGTIAGYFGSGAAGHPNKGYTLVPPYGQANYTNENFPNSVQTQVTGLNNSGLTVGFWSDQNNANAVNNNFGFVDNAGTFTNVNNPNTAAFNGVTVNQLLAVNNKNQAAGFYVDGAGTTHGDTYNIAANSFAEVTVAGATAVTAAGINDAGAVAGFYTNATGTTQGFILNGSTLTSVQDPNAVTTMILGLNNNGLADGVYTDAGGAQHGFTYDSALNSFATIDDPNGAGGTTLNGLNDQGQLTGFYVDGAGLTHGLLATPATAVPEPSSLPLMLLPAAAMIGIGWTGRRRRA